MGQILAVNPNSTGARPVGTDGENVLGSYIYGDYSPPGLSRWRGDLQPEPAEKRDVPTGLAPVEQGLTAEQVSAYGAPPLGGSASKMRPGIQRPPPFFWTLFQNLLIMLLGHG